METQRLKDRIALENELAAAKKTMPSIMPITTAKEVKDYLAYLEIGMINGLKEHLDDMKITMRVLHKHGPNSSREEHGPDSTKSLFDSTSNTNLSEFPIPLRESTAMLEYGNCRRCNQPLDENHDIGCICCVCSGNPYAVGGLDNLVLFEHNDPTEPCPFACFCDPSAMHTVNDHRFHVCTQNHKTTYGDGIPHVAADCDLCHRCGAKHRTWECPDSIRSGKIGPCICGNKHLFGDCPQKCRDCNSPACRKHCFYCGDSVEKHESMWCPYIFTTVG